MLRLEPEGVTVVELAPGVDLKRDVLAQAEFPLRVDAEPARDGPRSFPSRTYRADASPGGGGGSVSAFVELTFEGPIALLTLKRAEKLNALDRAMIDALGDAAGAIEASRDVRVAILSGEGKAFCAGGDIARLERSAAARDVARLDTGGASRVRSACASARPPDRGAHRPRLRRRPRTGGGRGHPHRRERNQAWPSRIRARHGAGMVRHPAACASIWLVGRSPHGARLARCSPRRKRSRSVSSMK